MLIAPHHKLARLTSILKLVLSCTYLLSCSAYGSQVIDLVDQIQIGKLPDLQPVTEDGWRAGFIMGGKEVYFGNGCWSYDIDHRQLKCGLPKALSSVLLSRDGEVLFGCVGKQETPYYLNTLTGRSSTPKYCPSWQPVNGFHPNKKSYIDDTRINGRFQNIDLINIFQGETRSGPPFRSYSFATVDGYASGGRYIVMRSNVLRLGLVDSKTLRLMPPLPELDIKHPSKIYQSPALTYNADVSMLAGQSNGEQDGVSDDETERNRTYLYDRKSKRFLWRYKDLGTPIAFSANSQFLLTGGRIVEVATGNVVQDGIKGTRGKFSPDGRSLVTMDDDAFYIYTLPKGSSAVFGVVPVVR